MRRKIIKILVKLERGRITISDAVDRLSLIIGPINDRERQDLETLAIRQLTIKEVLERLRYTHQEDAA